MKKIIVFIALFAIISCYTFKGYKCPDKKAKSKACLIFHYTKDDKSEGEFIIHKKCKQGEKCSKDISSTSGAGHVYICDNTRAEKYLVGYGKKCQYNEDCLAGVCKDKKCAEYKNCEKCDKEYFCSQKSDTSEYKCQKYHSEYETFTEEDSNSFKNRCAPGLVKFTENFVTKCIKTFSIEDKKACSVNIQCKSGLCFNSICVTVKQDPVCTSATPVTNGQDSEQRQISTVCEEIKGISGKFYPEINKKRYDYFKKKVVKRIEKLNLDKLRKKKYNDYKNLHYVIDKYNIRHSDKKLQKYYTIFTNWNELYARGLINDEGKKKSDKKCEYKFFMREYLSSSTLKSSLNYSLVILAFLF